MPGHSVFRRSLFRKNQKHFLIVIIAWFLVPTLNFSPFMIITLLSEWARKNSEASSVLNVLKASVQLKISSALTVLIMVMVYVKQAIVFIIKLFLFFYTNWISLRKKDEFRNSLDISQVKSSNMLRLILFIPRCSAFSQAYLWKLIIFLMKF